MPFFEAADAIFINYTWKEGTPGQAAAVAGARKHDVYMGVDVFGRNTYGGGGMACNLALTAARSAGDYSPPILCMGLHCRYDIHQQNGRSTDDTASRLTGKKLLPGQQVITHLPHCACWCMGLHCRYDNHRQKC